MWKYSQHFHKELNQLLSEKESAARIFDSFSSAEGDAAETHIALGNLYRRRGEIDRAIMVHETLANQASEQAISDTAKFELAKDYNPPQSWQSAIHAWWACAYRKVSERRF